MSDVRPTAAGEQPPVEPERTVRRIIEQLQGLDPETARYLDALAFILTRVADADDHISAQETRQIEQILLRCAKLPAAQAVLVAEIAKHRNRLADCACAYRVSRELRLERDREQRQRLLSFLYEVASADGQILGCEQEAIAQIAAELGIDRSEVPDLEGMPQWDSSC